MAKILDREATIKTVSVEIKALTVNGKQVTQALFRQLQEEPIVDDVSLKFNGVPWGRINYHVGCDPDMPHLHFVWQKGEELRRSCVYERHGKVLAAKDWREYDGWWSARFLHALKTDRLLIDRENRVAAVGGLTWRGISYELLNRMEEFERTRSFSIEGYNWSGLVQTVRKLAGLQDGWEEFSPEYCADEVRRTRDAAKAIEAEWADLYRSLQDLDQLFIAV